MIVPPVIRQSVRTMSGHDTQSVSSQQIVLTSSEIRHGFIRLFVE
ncbi:hypothetical protein GDI1587 [Gluconacetobacter diazotrophicus PA1 5]|uniref:Uncharacterized protein n=1 Tax=Gluconacetobacter diazotrophicus (strain ATCC 49037 / DSM 5601 / CCUG 37298 / CIP 103539 / LMG 7603 / PAl5) TaxID=272568 RepID=A9HGP4_GLUDA|nr:hypothetical protein GDI1587 [Gluconacetobacter diazotrophicus PA1 5]